MDRGGVLNAERDVLGWPQGAGGRLSLALQITIYRLVCTI